MIIRFVLVLLVSRELFSYAGIWSTIHDLLRVSWATVWPCKWSLATFSWESVIGSVLQPALCRVCQLWPWSFIPNSQPHGYNSVSFLTLWEIVNFFSSCFSSCYVGTWLQPLARGKWGNSWDMVIYQAVQQTPLTWYLVHLKIKIKAVWWI